MKKLGLLFKETSQKCIKDNLKGANTVFVIKYAGVASPDLSSLRQSLKAANANLFVVKNSVARRALKDTQLEPLAKNIEGSCGLVFINDDPVSISSVLCKFVKEHEKMQLEAGILQDKLLEKKDIEAMSKLPSKEVLRAQVVMTLNAPISGLVVSLNQIIAKFVYCLDQIKQKKGN